MSKRLLMASIGVAAAVGLALSTQAETLHFVYSESGGIDFSFDQSSAPTPISYASGAYAQVPVSDFTGSVGPYSSIVWYSLSFSGMFTTPDRAYVVFGPQVYGGPESAPVFAPGVFPAADQTNGLSGVLTVTAVPEPASWALMLVGIVALGAGLRSRKASLASA